MHDRTLEGFNAGTDVWTLMREIELPPELRVGQGYGKVAWAVRTFWEEYVGWFKLQSTTELYPDPAPAALAELVDARRAPTPRSTAPRPRSRVATRCSRSASARRSRPWLPTTRGCVPLMAGAHRYLLDHGGDVSFWEHGWLRTELARWEAP